MPTVVLRAGAANPNDIVLRLFATDAVVSTFVPTTIVLYKDTIPALVCTAGVADVTLWAGAASPSDVVLRSRSVASASCTTISVPVILRSFGQLDVVPPVSPVVIDWLPDYPNFLRRYLRNSYLADAMFPAPLEPSLFVEPPLGDLQARGQGCLCYCRSDD